MFATRQNRHLYVVNNLIDYNSTNMPSEEGDLKINTFTTEDKEAYMWFTYYGKGGLQSSPKWKIDKTTYLKKTMIENMSDTLPKYEVKITGTGSELKDTVITLKVVMRQFVGLGDDDTNIRLGSYKVKENDTASDIAKGLYNALINNMTKDLTKDGETYQYFTPSINGDTIKFVGTTQNYVRGKFSANTMIMPFDVYITTHSADGVSNYEFITDPKTNKTTYTGIAEVTNTTASTLHDSNNGWYKILDLEYFSMGERGDQYRMMGYPRNLDTEYMLSKDTIGNYDSVVDLRFFFSGDGMNSQHSESEITFVCYKAGTISLDQLPKNNLLKQSQSSSDTIGDSIYNLLKDIISGEFAPEESPAE